MALSDALGGVADAQRIGDLGRTLQLFRIESKRLKLSAPFSWRIAEPLDADAAGQATFYCCLNKIGCEEGERDGHIDLPNAALLAGAKVCDRGHATHPSVSVDVNLQQRPRMIGRPPCRLRLDAAKAQLGHIKLIDKAIDCPNRIILRQIVFQPLGKQNALTAVIANDQARHRILRPNGWRIISLRVFSHSLDPSPTSTSRSCCDAQSVGLPFVSFAYF